MQNHINYVDWMTPNYNLGDEALYEVQQKILQKHNITLDRITNRVKQKHGQTTIIGGGTSLPLISVYMRRVKYTYVFGSGVQDPTFYGSSDPALIDRFKSLNCRLISVRGNISKARLSDWGIQSELIGDPCLSLEPKTTSKRQENKIAINVGTASPKYSWNGGERFLTELTKACQTLKTKGNQLIIIPFWKENLADVQKFSQMANIPIFENWQDTQAVLDLMSTCKLIIGEKLHSLVLSAAANTPFIGLAYAPEHFDFTDSVGFSKFTVPITEITTEKIMTMHNDLQKNYETIQKDLSKIVNQYRQKQAEFALKIISDLNSLPDDKWDTQNNFKNTLTMRADLLMFTKMNKTWRVWNKLLFSRLTPKTTN